MMTEPICNNLVSTHDVALTWPVFIAIFMFPLTSNSILVYDTCNYITWITHFCAIKFENNTAKYLESIQMSNGRFYHNQTGWQSYMSSILIIVNCLGMTNCTRKYIRITYFLIFKIKMSKYNFAILALSVNLVLWSCAVRYHYAFICYQGLNQLLVSGWHKAGMNLDVHKSLFLGFSLNCTLVCQTRL